MPKMSLEEAARRGLELPESIWLHRRTGKPMISFEDWQQFGRWRRFRDILCGRNPVNPAKLPPEYRRPPSPPDDR